MGRVSQKRNLGIGRLIMKTMTYDAMLDVPDTTERIRRLQSLAWLLDNSIVLPGGYRIGFDAVIGLIPVFGDAIGALISAYIVNEARSIGVPRSVLLRMAANVAIESILGSVPLAGDLFDAAYKANSRNLALLTRYHADPQRSRRNSRLFALGITLAMISIVVLMIAIPIMIAVAVLKMF